MEQKLNQLLHQQNLSMLDAKFYHGKYFKKGIAQPPVPEKPADAVFNLKGAIIFYDRKMS